jgi:hypothetical protein
VTTAVSGNDTTIASALVAGSGIVLTPSGSTTALTVASAVNAVQPSTAVTPANRLTVAVPSATNTFTLPSAGTWLVTGAYTLNGVTTGANGTYQQIVGAYGTDTKVCPNVNGALSIPFAQVVVGSSFTITLSIGNLTAIGPLSSDQFVWVQYCKLA